MSTGGKLTPKQKSKQRRATYLSTNIGLILIYESAISIPTNKQTDKVGGWVLLTSWIVIACIDKPPK